MAAQVDKITLPSGEVVVLPDADKILGYGELTTWEGQDVDLCRLMFAKGQEHLFSSCCKVMNEQTGVFSYLDPTPAQAQVVRATSENRWVIVSKYRQAKTSTILLMQLLRDTMLIRGTASIIIGNKGATSAEIFRRITFAYKEMAKDPDFKGMVAPLDPKRKSEAFALFFDSGSSIQLLSAAASSAGVGYSSDRILFTEVGEVEDLEDVTMQLLPGIWKRPHAAVWMESTTGKMGSEHERLWLESYAGSTRFKAVFLEWWRDDSCWKDPDGFEPTDEEISYMERHEGMDLGNLAYRREAIASIYSGDKTKFAAKHPSDYRDGWLGGSSPTLPTEPLLDLLVSAVDDPTASRKYGVGIITPPVPGRTYAVICDPNRFGEDGDVSAIEVFDLWSNEEVAVFEGREQPTETASRVTDASDYYNNALIVVEANAEGVVTALVDRGYSRRMFWSKRRSPGWWASTLSIQRGETRLTEMLTGEEIGLRSRGTLQQLIPYSPESRTRRQRTDGTKTTRHFDRARCVVMYADVRCQIPVRPPRKVDDDSGQDVTTRDDGVIIISFADDFDKPKRSVGRGLPYKRR